jgi:trigger factor
MEYQVEEISPVETKVTVTVPAEEVNAAIMATTALYKGGVDIKGFRKGKVPASVVEKKYRQQIYGEATQDLVNYQLNQILNETEARPIAGVHVDAEEIAKDEDFVYSFSYEKAPAFDLPQYKGLSVEQETAEIDEEEMNQVIDRIRANASDLVDVEENRLPQDGDVVTIDFAALEDGEGFEGLRQQNFQLALGEGQALEDFEEIVKTVKPGDSTVGTITFPEDFINPEMAGKEVEIKVHLHGIKEKKLPEVDDNLAAKAGFADLETMKTAIRESYLQSRQQLFKSKAQTDLIDQALEQVEFPLPPSLVEQNIDQLIADRKQRLESKGKSLESLGKTGEELREDFREHAEKMARTQILLTTVAEAEGLEVSEQEIDFEIEKMARQAGQEAGQLRRYYEEHGALGLIKDRLLHDKAMDLIYDEADVTEVEQKDEEAPASEAAASTSEEE